MTMGMSKDMYAFIMNYKHRIPNIDLETGTITTAKRTNGTVCSSTGYLRVKVNKKLLQVHQVLAVCYFGEQCIGMQINHIDGNKTNNLKTNLEVVTQIENIKHGWEKGLSAAHPQTNRKLNEDQVRFIRENHIRKGKFTTAYFANKFSVSRTAVRQILTGVTYKEIL